MAKRTTDKASRGSRARKTGNSPELASQKREFIETFFKRGAEFAEELMRENERLRFRLAEQASADDKPGGTKTSAHAELDANVSVAELARRLEAVERERQELLQRFEGVAAENKDYQSRYQEIERENNNLANLYVASHQLHSTLDLRELTQIIVEILLNFIGAKTFAVQLVDEERALLRTLASEGVERERVPETHVTVALQRRLSEGAIEDPIGEVLRSGSPVFATGRFHPRPVSAPPVIAVPLKIDDKVVGVISVWELLAQKSGLVDVDFELFNLLGDHAGSALQSAKLNSELEGRPPALWVAADLV